MFRFLSCLLLLTIASAQEDSSTKHDLSYYEQMFKEWALKFEIEIEEAVYDSRLAQWAENHDLIETHNAMNATYKLGHNIFSHMSNEEWRSMLGFNPSRAQPKRTGIDGSALLGMTRLPNDVDWVDQGAVTKVKNQGSCGSCWSFSTAGAMEGAYYLSTGKLVDFSEQMLVDCDSVDQGCNGGLMDNAFGFVKEQGGLCSYDDYPYTGQQGTCQKDCKLLPGSAVVDWVDVGQSEAALLAALSKQPVSVAIEADQIAFQLYKSGVFTGRCSQNLDHGVLAVGFGTADGIDYFKIKNSWGPEWGESGYIRIQRKGNACGIQNAASYPVLEAAPQ